MSTFGVRLSEERRRLGLTQEQAAAIASVTRHPYRAWEKEVTAPDVKQLSALAAAGIDVQYIVTGKRDPFVIFRRFHDEETERFHQDLFEREAMERALQQVAGWYKNRPLAPTTEEELDALNRSGEPWRTFSEAAGVPWRREYAEAMRVAYCGQLHLLMSHAEDWVDQVESFNPPMTTPVLASYFLEWIEQRIVTIGLGRWNILQEEFQSHLEIQRQRHERELHKAEEALRMRTQVSGSTGIRNGPTAPSGEGDPGIPGLSSETSLPPNPLQKFSEVAKELLSQKRKK
jgi:transcriptional regulator with XRE-family HTH domain